MGGRKEGDLGKEKYKINDRHLEIVRPLVPRCFFRDVYRLGNLDLPSPDYNFHAKSNAVFFLPWLRRLPHVPYIPNQANHTPASSPPPTLPPYRYQTSRSAAERLSMGPPARGKTF